jgi:hypothetical protein
MTRMILLQLAFLTAATAFHSAAFAQDEAAAAMAKLNVVLPRAAEEQLALRGAPEHLRAGASIYVFGKQGFELSRKGTNGFTCLVNRDAFLYGGDQFKPTCWDAQGATTYVPVMLKVGELLARRASADAIKQAIDAGFADQTFRAPNTGGIAYMLAGDVDIDPSTGHVTRTAFPGHYMFYALGATSERLGTTREAARKDPTLPGVFAGGAGGSHGLAYIIAIRGADTEHGADGK